jgi:hypothetical protein
MAKMNGITANWIIYFSMKSKGSEIKKQKPLQSSQLEAY